ncbi:MAG: hypothetical protein J6Z49_03425 [Kiritimatiellae bacterium]|nr:hypothetical protein [Kiritimatiellia bacterium]
MNNDKIQLISQSPFVKDADENGWSFEVTDPETGNRFNSSISPWALLHSLGEERIEIELLVCGCSDAGCAGLDNEIFECSEKCVHWSFTEYGHPYSWFFDRTVYETGAMQMLHEIYVTQKGWDFNALEYESYDAFKNAIDDFLVAKPVFKRIWDNFAS